MTNAYVKAYDMSMINKVVTLSASDARSDLYNLIKKAGKGQESYEIVLRGSAPVIMMSKDEVESWMETLDVMSSPETVAAIKAGEEETGGIALEELEKQLDNKYGSKHGTTTIKKARRKRT